MNSRTPAKKRTRNRPRSWPLNRQRTRQGVVSLEFAMLLPLFLLMTLFAVDMGRLIVVNGAVADATFHAARVGAQTGGACPNNRTQCDTHGVSADAFYATVDAYPAISRDGVPVGDGFRVETGGICTSQNRHITIRTEYEIKPITPGLYTLAGLVSDGWSVSNVAVVRCDVVRS